MAVKERTQQLRIVAEILLIHLPEYLAKDQPLAHDLLSVAGQALNTIYEDAEASSKSWDKRAYHVRADELRREWDWALGAANFALGLALRPAPLTDAHLAKLKVLIRPELERPARKQIADPTRFRGAAQALAKQLSQKRKPLRE